MPHPSVRSIWLELQIDPNDCELLATLDHLVLLWSASSHSVVAISRLGQYGLLWVYLLAEWE